MGFPFVYFVLTQSRPRIPDSQRVRLAENLPPTSSERVIPVLIPDILEAMIRKTIEFELAMDNALNYQEWYEAALAYDAQAGLDVWRREKESDDYDYRLIASRVALIRKLRRQKDYDQLVFRLREELHGNLGNMANPALYSHAKGGTKKLVEDFVNEVTAALDEMCDADVKTLPPAKKRRFFKRAARSFGRSALLLSGGASLGLFHVGVVRELQEQHLLPRVITGASVGSIVGSVIASHTEPELEELFQSDIEFAWSRLMGVPAAVKGGGLMDPAQLRRVIEKNIPNLTFLEAYEKTRRILNISISPADTHQFPRLLNYLTAPNVLIRQATMASKELFRAFGELYAAKSLDRRFSSRRHPQGQGQPAAQRQPLHRQPDKPACRTVSE
jgi:hypothetical protein